MPCTSKDLMSGCLFLETSCCRGVFRSNGVRVFLLLLGLVELREAVFWRKLRPKGFTRTVGVLGAGVLSCGRSTKFSCLGLLPHELSRSEGIGGGTHSRSISEGGDALGDHGRVVASVAIEEFPSGVREVSAPSICSGVGRIA